MIFLTDVFTARQGDDKSEDMAGLAMLVGAGLCSGNTRDEIFTDQTALPCLAVYCVQGTSCTVQYQYFDLVWLGLQDILICL